MTRKDREIPEIFGVSLMDTVSCGIGASILMMLLFVTMVEPSSDVKSVCENCKDGLELDAVPNEKQIASLIVEVFGLEDEELLWAPSSTSLTELKRQGVAIRASHSKLYSERGLSLVRESLSHRLFLQLRESRDGSELPRTVDMELSIRGGSGDFAQVSMSAFFARETRGDVCSLQHSGFPLKVTLRRIKESNTYELDNCGPIR